MARDGADSTSATCASPRWKCGTVRACTFERARLVLTVSTVTPRGSRVPSITRTSRSNERKASDDQTTRGACRPDTRRLGGAPVLPGPALQGRDCGGARPEPVQDRASARHGPRQRIGSHRDRSPESDRRRSGRADYGPVRVEARSGRRYPGRSGRVDAATPRTGRSRAARRGHRPRGRARRCLVPCGRRDGQSVASAVLSPGRPTHWSHLDAERRPQLDRHRARRRPGRQRTGIRSSMRRSPSPTPPPRTPYASSTTSPGRSNKSPGSPRPSSD